MDELTSNTTSNTQQNSNANNTNNTNNAFLETSKAERAMWLMKCPPLVSRSLQSPPPPDAPSSADSSRYVAKVVLSIDPLRSNDDNASTQFTMELAGTESGHIPKCYSMDMSKDLIPMSVFSESSQGKLCVEGKILNKFDMKPHNQDIENYGKLCRERTNKYMTKTRQIQVIGNDNGAHMRPLPGMMSFVTSAPSDKKKMPAKGSEAKRTRRDRTEMEEIMFKLFERQPHWTLRQLIQETDQPEGHVRLRCKVEKGTLHLGLTSTVAGAPDLDPRDWCIFEQFMKDILKDLCVYNNKGANQGSYELKPEYRRTNEEPTPK